MILFSISAISITMTEKSIDIVGLGNPLVDVIVEVDEALFTSLKLEKGSERLVSDDELHGLLQKVAGKSPRLVSGGSVANSIVVAAQLGSKAGFIGSLGNDEFGQFFNDECLALSIVPPALVEDLATGTCIALITPDAERTMRVALAAASKLNEKQIDAPLIERSRWLFIEGYPIANPEAKGQAAIRKALSIAKKAKTKVALTLSDAFIPEVFGKVVDEFLPSVDLLFCNEKEVFSLTNKKNRTDAVEVLKTKVPQFVVTIGEEGAMVWDGKLFTIVPGARANPIDLLGAGDMFAGTFLHCITHGYDYESAAQTACYMAARVIEVLGARLPGGANQVFKSYTEQ